MSMHIDGKKVAAMYWGGQKIREAWHEGQRVFSGKPVEVMPPTVGSYDAMDWLRAKLAEYGEDHQTVEEIPFEIDSSQVTDMINMFQNCYALTSAPAMDTRNVAYMGGMFRGCSSLTTVPDMDTSKVLATIDVPAGETWLVAAIGQVTPGVSGGTYLPDLHLGGASRPAAGSDGTHGLATVATESISFTIKRNSSSGADTFTGHVYTVKL